MTTLASADPITVVALIVFVLVIVAYIAWTIRDDRRRR